MSTCGQLTFVGTIRYIELGTILVIILGYNYSFDVTLLDTIGLSHYLDTTDPSLDTARYNLGPRYAETFHLSSGSVCMLSGLTCVAVQQAVLLPVFNLKVYIVGRRVHHRRSVATWPLCPGSGTALV
jgi:hypothetical protein